MKVVLEWLRRLRWCARLDPLILSAIVMSLLSVVSAAQTSGTYEWDQQCPQTRKLVTTVWGGAVTILALSFDIWGAGKTLFSIPSAPSLTMGILNPLIVLSTIIKFAASRYNRWRRMPGFTVLSLLSPWTKDRAKIVYSGAVVISVPTGISIPENFTESRKPSLLEAVVIGRGPEDARETTDVCLGVEGKEVLLQMKNVLPPYDQLTVLQGKSGLLTIISAVQSVGYIYGVVVRSVQGLPVSPIEVVALTLSIQILIKALLHNSVSVCHRPLHVYLTHIQAQTFVDQCEYHTAHEDSESLYMGRSSVGAIVYLVSVVAIVVLISGVAIYYIIHMWQTTRRIMVVPIMLTLVGLYLQLIWVCLGFFTKLEGVNTTVVGCSVIMCALVNATSYIFALVVTIKYWKVDSLNTNTSSMLAQIFPYIG
jgi:hypothetical protein